MWKKSGLAVLMLIGVLAFGSFTEAFSDVDIESKYFGSVNYLWENEFINGYEDGSFKPENTINRAEFLKMVVGMRFGEIDIVESDDCFIDVPSSEWYAKYICLAKAESWVEGYAGGYFRPEKFIQRDEAIKIIAEVFKDDLELSEDVVIKLPVDVEAGSWVTPYLRKLISRGLIEYDGEMLFGSGVLATRGYVSEVLYRLFVTKDNDLSSFEDYVVEGPFLVTRVVDGDTIHVESNGEIWKIRFIGVDTPESVHPSKPVEFFALEASQKVKTDLLGKYIMLEADLTQANQDKYGRYLRYIRLLNGENYNKILLSQGYGFEYTFNNIPYKYKKQFDEAEKIARENNLGLWVENGNVSDGSNGNDMSDETSFTENQDRDYAFYVSSQARTKYYCETDLMWRNLSVHNLLKYDTEEVLKNNFPSLSLNQPC